MKTVDLEGIRDPEALGRVLETLPDRPEAHEEAARACERQGLPDLAAREWEIVLRLRPDHALALRRLAEAALERGDEAGACGFLRRLLEVRPEDGEAKALLEGMSSASPGRPEDPARESEVSLSDADLARFLDLFQGREDVHARQWCDPGGRHGYSPVPQPLTPVLLRNHILGNATLGVYVIRLDGTVKFLALDVDIGKRALEEASGLPDRAAGLRKSVHEAGLRLYRGLSELGLPALLEDSGFKGRHLWIPLETPIPAGRAFELGRRLAGRFHRDLPPELHVEYFPKQPSTEAGRRGLGNLIKLPLGIHRRSGRRSRFLDSEGRPVEDWRSLLSSIRRAVPGEIERVLALLESPPVLSAAKAEEPEAPPAAPPLPAPPSPAPPWSDADFERHPEISRLVRGCAVLGELVRQVRETRSLDRDEQVVVAQVLGRSPAGVAAVNYLFERCPDIGREARLKSPLAGNPISCAAVRRRLPHLAGRAGCACEFPGRKTYPSPVLHLRGASAGPPAAGNPPPPPGSETDEDLARRHAACAARLREVAEEEKGLRKALLDRLRVRPERALELPEGRLSIREIGGVEELHWEPRS